MDSADYSAPVKPPRQQKQARETSGLLMSVIRTLSASETNEQRDREKAKLEKEFDRCDQRLDALVGQNEHQLAQVTQIFSNVSSIVSSSRARIKGTRARLTECKQLLRWRRSELRRLCSEGAQHKHALELLEHIERLTKVGTELGGHLTRGHFLNGAVVLQSALTTANTNLYQVEALQHLRSDLEIKKQLLYDRLITQLNLSLYKVNVDDTFFKRQGSSRRPEMPRLVSIQSEDGSMEITPQMELTLSDENKTLNVTLAILVESFATIKKIKEASENTKVQMQTELLQVISTTSQYILDMGVSQIPLTQTQSIGDLLDKDVEISKKEDQEAQNAQPLVELISVLLQQFRIIAERHETLIDILKHSLKKHNLQYPQIYTMDQYWSRVQAVLQLLLTDYLDIQSLKSGPQRIEYQDQPVNTDINSYFIKKKAPSKKKNRLFKFSGSAVEKVISKSAEHIEVVGGNKGYKLVCIPAPEHLSHIFHLLDDFMDEIEVNASMSECSLRVYLGELVKGVQSEIIAIQLRTKINEFCSELNAWRELTTAQLNASKTKSLFKCAVYSWDSCATTLNNALKLRNLGGGAARGAIAPALNILNQSARRYIAQQAPRVKSHVWLSDDDITRFLKSLPNWSVLKHPPVKGKNTFVAQDMKQSFEREAEILGSSLGDGNVTEKEIISNINILKEIAIMCETMEWLSVKINQWRSNCKPAFNKNQRMNGVSASPSNTKSRSGSSYDALLAELALSALHFQELSENCLLLLHLEVRMQCFHYLGRLGGTLGLAPSITTSSSSSHLTSESPATSLARILQQFYESVTPVLHHRRLNYIMDGLGEMMSAVIVAGWRGGGIGAANATSQLEPLRHCLTAAQISPEGLHKAALYLQMLTMTHEEILLMVAEKGAVFSELEYMNAFQVIAKSSNMSEGTLKNNLNKLSNILGNVGVTV